MKEARMKQTTKIQFVLVIFAILIFIIGYVLGDVFHKEKECPNCKYPLFITNENWAVLQIYEDTYYVMNESLPEVFCRGNITDARCLFQLDHHIIEIQNITDEQKMVNKMIYECEVEGKCW